MPPQMAMTDEEFNRRAKELGYSKGIPAVTPEVVLPGTVQKTAPEIPNNLPAKLERVVLPNRQEPMGEKVKGLWAVLENVVEQLILTAEATIPAPKSGSDKRSYVRLQVIRFLKELEAKHDYLPAAIQAIAFTALEWGIDLVIDRVFNELVKRGLVNVPA